MNALYEIVALFLVLNIAAGLLRIWWGPTTGDRLMAIQLFGTTGSAILLLLSMSTGIGAYRDVALVFALLAGVVGVTFTRYWRAEESETTPTTGDSTGAES